MLDILDTVRSWQQARLSVALATLVEVRGSAPRTVGSTVAVNERGEVAGSLSGGCIESDVYETARAVLGGAAPADLWFDAGDEELGTGLSCGGVLRVAVRRLTSGDRVILESLQRALECGRAVRLATPIAGDPNASLILVDPTQRNGTPVSERFVTTKEWPAVGASLCVGADGGDYFVAGFAPKPDLYIFGALDFSRAMATIGRFAGYRVTVVDPRPVFATSARIPEADRIVIAWPDEYLARAPVTASTAIVILVHDEKFELPLLRIALAGPAGYVGALGSRRTHARRLARLRDDGVSEAGLARLHAPIGLDIGALTPEETALSIAAEIVASRNGRLGGRLRDGCSSLQGPADEPSRALVSA